MNEHAIYWRRVAVMPEEKSASPGEPETVIVHVASSDVTAIGSELNRANVVWRTFAVSRSGIAAIEVQRADAQTLNAALEDAAGVFQLRSHAGRHCGGVKVTTVPPKPPMDWNWRFGP